MSLKPQQWGIGAWRRLSHAWHLRGPLGVTRIEGPRDSVICGILACSLLVMVGCVGQAESDAGQRRSPVSNSHSLQESDSGGGADQQERDNAASAHDQPLLADSAYHVYPGDDIQKVLEIAAQDAVHKTVVVHAGTYRPRRHGQAMIWFNAAHDGITLQAEGEVILTAANPDLAYKTARSYPAVVNHIVFFGDGISRQTVLRGFHLTGANNFMVQSDELGSIEPDSPEPALKKGLLFYADGGAIKIFGRSYPTIEDVEIYDNYTSPCGAGISVEHRGFVDNSVLIRNSIFRNNRTEITGSAVDLLRGSSAVIENCLFLGNISNTGDDYISLEGEEYNRINGSGALTVFPQSRVKVDRSTFTGNWNGVDDKGRGNVYTNTIFWMNNIQGGNKPGARYEIDILDGSGVSGCLLRGDISDLRASVDREKNFLDAPDPDFDQMYRPRSREYALAGYRPASD